MEKSLMVIAHSEIVAKNHFYLRTLISKVGIDYKECNIFDVRRR